MPEVALEVVILAAGVGERLERGPKAFLRLNGQTLLERAIELGLQLTPSVTVAVPEAHLAEAERLVGGRARTLTGGRTRLETFSRLVEAGAGRMLVLHDVVHPLTTRGLAQRVIESAGEDAAAMAVGTIHDYVIGRDTSVAAAPSEVGVLQKPIVFPRDAAREGLRLLAAATSVSDSTGSAGRAPAAVEIFRLAGIDVRLVQGEPWNVKITHEADWQLIQALARGVPAGATPDRGEAARVGA